MYDYVAEENGRKFTFLIRIDYYVSALMSDFRQEKIWLFRQLESPESDKNQVQKELDELNLRLERQIKEEDKKLDKFCEIMCTTNKTYKEAEEECFGYFDYDLFPDRLTSEGKRLDEDADYHEQGLKKQSKKGNTERVILEKGLSHKKKEQLLGKGYKRLKLSPFGDGGAAYYWLKTRYNEGKEHAFFCYLIESEAKKHIRKVKLNVNNGPDVEFEYKKKKYCFDVETGKKLERSKVSVDWKYSKYQREYDYIFILVTRKSLKYKFNRYGTVITRAKLKDTVSSIFA